MSVKTPVTDNGIKTKVVLLGNKILIIGEDGMTISEIAFNQIPEELILDSSGNCYVRGPFTTAGIGRQLASVTNTGTLNDFSPTFSSSSNVLDIISDGGTGYYVASFNEIYHLDSNGIIDLNFNANFSTYVYAMALDATYLYVGGQFTTANGTSRNRIARIDKNTGVLDLTWDPNINSGSRVESMVLEGTDLYIAGSFSQVSTTARTNAAKIDSSTGTLDGSWIPNPNNTTKVIKSDINGIYFGGEFTSIGGSSRNRIARVDKVNGTADSFNPGATGTVNDIAIDGTNLYVVGNFGGMTIAPGVAYAIKMDTSAVPDLTWDPDSSRIITTVAFDSVGVYLGSTISGTLNGNTTPVTFNNIGKVNKTDGTADASWTSLAGTLNDVNIIFVNGNNIIYGGNIIMVNIKQREWGAKIDSNGDLTNWDPRPSGSIDSLVINGSDVYLAGDFETINDGASVAYKFAIVNNTDGTINT